jgi:hypothetical protein
MITVKATMRIVAMFSETADSSTGFSYENHIISIESHYIIDKVSYLYSDVLLNFFWNFQVGTKLECRFSKK